MDLSLRSYVGGWKAIFLEDTTCLNELPASFFAYRKQQHRWTCGPVQLWRKTGYYIWKSSLPLHRKVGNSGCFGLEFRFIIFGAKCAPHLARAASSVHASARLSNWPLDVLVPCPLVPLAMLPC